MDMEQVRDAVVRLVIAVRDRSELRMWDQAQSRLRMAASLSRSAEEFTTALQHTMRAEMTSSVSSAMAEVVSVVGTDARPMLRMVAREHGYLIASAQRLTEERLRAAKARKEDRRAVALEGEVAEMTADALGTALETARASEDLLAVAAIEAEQQKREAQIHV